MIPVDDTEGDGDPEGDGGAEGETERPTLGSGTGTDPGVSDAPHPASPTTQTPTTTTRSARCPRHPMPPRLKRTRTEPQRLSTGR